MNGGIGSLAHTTCRRPGDSDAPGARFRYKIGADLEQGYVDAAAGEQVGQCGTGRAGADNREARHLSPAPPGAAPHEA